MVENVNILGTDYKITLKRYDEDEAFARRSIDGYCDGYLKEIVVCDMNTNPNWKKEPKKAIDVCQKEILRHEIVHGFLNESGLCDSAFTYNGAWSRCEEMVDWIALQGEKIYRAWIEAECIS